MMKHVKLSYNNGSYAFSGGSSEDMNILGCFLSSDVGCYWGIPFRDWALANKEDPDNEFTYSVGGNITFLEEDEGFIFLEDLYSEEKVPTRLKMSRQQFVQLLDDWHEKVCKPKPKKVIIKHENGQFVIETKD